MSIVNNRIKNVRVKAGQTQEDFAYKVGISRSNLALIETDKTTPNYETIKKISNIYGINPTYFFVDEDVNIEDYTGTGNNVRNLDNGSTYSLPKRVPNASSALSRAVDSEISQRMMLLRDGKKTADAKLKRELSKSQPNILAIRDKVEDCNTVVEILSDVFTNYFDNAPDPSDLDYYAVEGSEAYVYNFPDEVDYKDYRNKFITYYQALEPYLPHLQGLKTCIEGFFKTVRPLDNQEIIN